jgi:hypothetical protein
MADEIETGSEPAAEGVSDNSAIIETTEAPEAPRSVDEALDRAFDTTFGDDRPRDDKGRFAPKDATPPDPQPAAEITPPVNLAPVAPDELAAPPAWLNSAKDEWSKAPKPLREALAGRFGELEQGIARYREQMAPYQPFFEQAKASGVDPVALVGRYVELDRAFTQNPLQGFEAIARSFGTDMRTIAAHVLGKEPQPVDAQVAHLSQRLEAATRELQGLRGVATQYQTEREAQIGKTIQDFSASHPRFEELAGVIKWALETKLAADLETAYTYAERLNPAPAATQPLVTASVASPAAARTGAPNPKTTLAISGAPSSGSNPANVPKSESVDQSISYALSKAFN